MPAAGNTHEIAQEVAPESRVVYVDNDPVVLAHARALLTSSAEGVTSFVEADAANPAAILQEARATLDFGQPVAVLLIDLLNFIGDGATVQDILRTLREAMAPGSYLVVVHPASDLDPPLEAAARRWNQMGATPVVLRSRAEVTGWADGLDLVEPGMVPATRWRPEESDAPAAMPLYGFVARKS
jgi:hypothetical protein